MNRVVNNTTNTNSNSNNNNSNKLDQPNFNLTGGSIKKLNQGKILHNTDKDNELITLKEQNMKLILEKNALKSENIRLEKELGHKEKLIQDVINQNQTGISGSPENFSRTLNKTKETYLVDKIKRQYKDLQLYSKQKEEELDKLKKNSKVTKISELSEEVRVLSLELSKLKEFNQHITSANSVLNKQVSEQNETIKAVKYKHLLEEEKAKRISLELQIKNNSLKKLEEEYSYYIKQHEISQSKTNQDDRNNVNNTNNGETSMGEVVKEREYLRELNR